MNKRTRTGINSIRVNIELIKIIQTKNLLFINDK